MSLNIELLNRRAAAVPRGVATALPVFVARAENAEVWDADGNRYVDFAGGIAVLNVGHRHPRVMAAVKEQLDSYLHVAFQVTAYEPYVELAERLNALAPFEEEARTLLLTTGAEAVENAVKIARAATGRQGVIAFTGGFHGRTALTMALTGKVTPYKRGHGAPVPHIYHLPFPVPHLGVTVDDSLRALQFLFGADMPPEEIAAIILEPVQGEGGFHAAPPELFASLRKICDEFGIVLIADEVQTGFARTGKMFAVEHILAQQMGTSVKMIEQHYGHVNTIKHADRVLMGIGGWDAMHNEMNEEIDKLEAKAKAVESIKAKQADKPSRPKR